MKVSIIIPAHNEEKRIGKTLTEYGNFFNRLAKENKLDYEIFVVINNTKDGTEKIVREFSKKNKRIKYVNVPQGGKGNAIIYGFKEKVKEDFDLIGFVDADLSTSPEEFYKLIININDYGGIIASRYLRGSIIKTRQPISRVIVSRIGNVIIRGVFLMSYRDTQCGAKLFRKFPLEKIIPSLGTTNWAFDIDLLYQSQKMGSKIREFPTVWTDSDRSTLKIKKASVQVFLSIMQLRIVNSPFKKSTKILKPLIRRLWNKVK